MAQGEAPGRGGGWGVLNGWKAIATHLRRDERTAMRWANERGMPVHRAPGPGRGSVYALPEEIDAWLAADRERVAEARTLALESAPPEAVPAASRPGRRLVLAGGGAAVAAGAVALLWRRGASGPAAPLMPEGLEAVRMGTAESTAQGIGFLRAAAEDAPRDAAAWGALALAYESGAHFLDDAAAAETRRHAEDAARRALAIDPGEVQARAARAIAVPTFRNWAAAEGGLRAVLASDPAQFETARALSYVLADVGRTRDALAVLDPIAAASALRPLFHYWRAYLLWAGDRADEADAVIDRALALWPRNYQVWFTRFWLYAYGGRTAAALAMSANRAGRPAGIPDWNFTLIDTSARALGSRAAADIEPALAANLAAARRGAGFAENAIQFAAASDRPDAAFAVADAYYFGRGFDVGTTRYTPEQGSFTRPAERQTRLLFAPSSRALRADPRFGLLTRALGLDDYWRARKSRPDYR